MNSICGYCGYAIIDGICTCPVDDEPITPETCLAHDEENREIAEWDPEEDNRDNYPFAGDL